VSSVTLALIDSGLVDIKTAAADEGDFIKSAVALLPNLKNTSEAADWRTNYIAQLLAKFNTPSSLAVLKEFAAAKDKYVKKNAVQLLVEHNQPVPPAALQALATDPETRKDVYDILKDAKKQALFPAQYLTQQYFAESAVFSAALGEDEDNERGAVASVTLAGKKTASYKGKNYVFYLYKVIVNDRDSSAYLGIGGGYAAGSTGLEPKEELSGVNWKDKYNALKNTQQLAAYLSSLENAEDENK
jgi:hypothetical protein